MGWPVALTAGERDNIKLTTPEDLPWAEAIAASVDGVGRLPGMGARLGVRGLEPRGLGLTGLRAGTGFDAHRFCEGRRLVLGGVEIPHERGLAGHSDADAPTHALIDALLGAAAMGDIGKAFPDTNPEYEGISSLKLLSRACEMLREAGCEPENADVTVIAERPKISAYTEMMRAALAGAMGVAAARVNVKATTTEGMGFTGRGEGIAAQAVATVNAPLGAFGG
jgi:2-C-methyl-D-erythritol 2,4-cyclodiphosphate synthase